MNGYCGAVYAGVEFVGNFITAGEYTALLRRCWAHDLEDVTVRGEVGGRRLPRKGEPVSKETLYGMNYMPHLD